MGHWVKYLSLKSGDLSSGPQNPCKAGPSDHICNPSLLLGDGKQTQRLRGTGQWMHRSPYKLDGRRTLRPELVL